MSQYRTKLVQMAFKKLDKDHSGIINLDDIRGLIFFIHLDLDLILFLFIIIIKSFFFFFI